MCLVWLKIFIYNNIKHLNTCFAVSNVDLLLLIICYIFHNANSCNAAKYVV